jgi:hypothetical protein
MIRVVGLACSRQPVIVLALILFSAGCADSQRQRVAIAKQAADEQRELALINGYYASDIAVAEQSLLRLADYYSTLRVHSVGGALAWTHTRLFLHFSQLARTNDAARHRELALRHYRGESSQTGGRKLE